MKIKMAYMQSNGIVAILDSVDKTEVENHLGLNILPNPDGTVSGGLSDADFKTLVMQAIPSDATNVHDLPLDWTPPDDGTFRNAWVTDGKAISVDLPKAKAIAVKLDPTLDVSTITSVDDLVSAVAISETPVQLVV